MKQDKYRIITYHERCYIQISYEPKKWSTIGECSSVDEAKSIIRDAKRGWK